MDPSKRLFPLLLLLALISAASAATKLGGYQPIKNLKDPEVVAMAKFAVSEHNKNGSDDLVFVKVLSGEQQVVAGMNFKLIILARQGAHSPGSKYQAVVYDRPWNKYRSLTSFAKL